MINAPIGPVSNAEYMEEFNELLEDKSIEELTWQVEAPLFCESWTAEVQMPGRESPAEYQIVFNGVTNPVRIFYKSPGVETRKKIGVVGSFHLAILCAEEHYRRAVHYRRSVEAGDPRPVPSVWNQWGPEDVFGPRYTPERKTSLVRRG